MRRTDREVTDNDEIFEIIKRCQICHVAFYDEDYPYVVPMNFGICINDGIVSLYFHGANEGRKHKLIKKNNKVSFVMENMISVITSDIACNSVAEFESVMGVGEIEYVSGEEKIYGLQLLMSHSSQKKKNFNFDDRYISMTSVFRLRVSSLSAKKLIR